MSSLRLHDGPLLLLYLLKHSDVSLEQLKMILYQSMIVHHEENILKFVHQLSVFDHS